MAEVACAGPRPPIKGIEGLRARLPRWEPAILLWLLLVAVLLLLVINPLLRLLITSFQDTRHPVLYACQLRPGVKSPLKRNRAPELAPLRGGGDAGIDLLRRSNRLCDLAHRYAKQGLCSGRRRGRLYHIPSYLGAVAWDFSGGAECRLAESSLDGAHRQQPGRSTSTASADWCWSRRCTRSPTCSSSRAMPSTWSRRRWRRQPRSWGQGVS